MTQVKTRRVTLTSIMGKHDFIEGMKDAQQGRPIRDQWESTPRGHVINRQWSYERGRMFFHYIKSQGEADMKVKDGRRVTLQAQVAYREACNEGWIR